MSALTQKIKQAWESREGPVVFTTVDEQGRPNSIYVSCVSRYDDETLVVADNYFDKTRKNILSGSKVSLLFITKGHRSYQIKGEVEYHTEGEIFDDMKRWNPPHRPGYGAAAIKVKAVFSGSNGLGLANGSSIYFFLGVRNRQFRLGCFQIK